MKQADLICRCKKSLSVTRGDVWCLKGSVALVVLGLLVTSHALGQDLSSESRSRGFERAPFDLHRFSERSDVIVRGIVANRETKWVGRAIYTHYDLVVLETIAGPARSAITVAVLGGAIGNVGLAVPGAPNLDVGNEIVFFGRAFEGQPSFNPVGLGAGVVPIIPAGGSGGASMVAPRGKPEVLEDFLDEVRLRRR